MTGLAIKDVQFNGATLRAAQDTENIGLKWFVNLYDHLFMIETWQEAPEIQE